MKVGQLVMLVGCDQFMPPLGSVGEIVGPLDEYGDHEVLFQRHPCPICEVTWEIPARWLMPLDKPFVISPLIELKNMISITGQQWDSAVALAEGQGMRLATVAEMHLPIGYYWSGTEYLLFDAGVF